MSTRKARYRAAARKAKNLTNKQLGTELAALAPISKDTMDALLPRKRDKQEFIALMQQVEKEKNMDENIVYLKENMTTAGEVVFKLLKVFV